MILEFDYKNTKKSLVNNRFNLYLDKNFQQLINNKNANNSQ